VKLTEKENLLLRRALDKASAPAEAAKAAEALVKSLRERGIDGYNFFSLPTAPPPRPTATPSYPAEEDAKAWAKTEMRRRNAARHQSDPKWDHIRQQREAAENKVAEDIINGKYDKKDFKPMIHWGIIIALGIFIGRTSPGAAVFYMLLVIAINVLVLWNTNRSR